MGKLYSRNYCMKLADRFSPSRRPYSGKVFEKRNNVFYAMDNLGGISKFSDRSWPSFLMPWISHCFRCFPKTAIPAEAFIGMGSGAYGLQTFTFSSNDEMYAAGNFGRTILKCRVSTKSCEQYWTASYYKFDDYNFAGNLLTADGTLYFGGRRSMISKCS